MTTQKPKITKRPTSKTPKVSDEDAQKFIDGAPDSLPPPVTRKGVQRGKREQISHTMPPDLLARLDKCAQTKGLTRAGLINLAVSEFLGKN